MGLFDFVKNAGEKITRKSGQSKEEANREHAALLKDRVEKLGFQVENFNIDYYDETATLKGIAPSQDVKEKVVLVVGNTQGVAKVNDLIRVNKAEIKEEESAIQAETAQEPEARFYTVKSGDSLSKIAKEFYGNATKYPEIFEANKPMLSDPNKIYPGQVLRIPKID